MRHKLITVTSYFFEVTSPALRYSICPNRFRFHS